MTGRSGGGDDGFELLGRADHRLSGRPYPESCARRYNAGKPMGDPDPKNKMLKSPRLIYFVSNRRRHQESMPLPYL